MEDESNKSKELDLWTFLQNSTINNYSLKIFKSIKEIFTKFGPQLIDQQTQWNSENCVKYGPHLLDTM